MMDFPFPDPIAFSIGPVPVRWYALAYLVGFVLGWQYSLQLVKYYPGKPTREDMDNYLTWAVFGVILGGRLGYVLFYNPAYYLQNLLDIFRVWQGGMSFHGGLIGVMTVTWFFCKRHAIPFWIMIDIVACVAPIGVFFGRIANFINGELYGRVTDVAWGVVFPMGGPLPRHPSQLYEAVLEGPLLLALLWVAARFYGGREKPGVLSGLFLAGYGVVRFAVEYVREPDAHLGLIGSILTMGQLLCLPMIIGGAALTLWAVRRPQQAARA